MKQALVIWSDEALKDLETIYDFISESSPSSARRLVEDLLSRARQLESFPESGAKEQTIQKNNSDYRYLVEGNYKIIYRYQPESQTVYIAVIFDTRNDPEKLTI